MLSIPKRALTLLPYLARTRLNKDRPPPGLLAVKLAAIDEYWERFRPRSFADLGGVWGVDGGYSFYAMTRPGTQKGFLVDTDFTSTVFERQKRAPALEFVVGNFGEPKVLEKLGRVDVVLLFDTLLHQVNPSWDELLRRCAAVTDGFILYNQQWISGPTTIRLLELGEERYMKTVPSDAEPYRGLFAKLDEIHPQHQRPYRDIHNVWQWGIVDADLMRVMDGLGFKLQLFRNCGQHGRLRDFEDHLFLYTRRR